MVPCAAPGAKQALLRGPLPPHIHPVEFPGQGDGSERVARKQKLRLCQFCELNFGAFTKWKAFGGVIAVLRCNVAPDSARCIIVKAGQMTFVAIQRPEIKKGLQKLKNVQEVSKRRIFAKVS